MRAQGHANAVNSTAPQTIPGVDEILFTLKVGNENHVAVVNTDGTAFRDIASCGAGECYPNWSPDGNKIVMERHNEMGSGIYLMDADGRNQIRLSPIPGFDVRASFSPTGKQLIFNHVDKPEDNGVPATDIMVMNIDGTGRHVLLPSNDTFNIEPRFSPDGSKITFMSNRDRSQQIYIMNADGTDLKKITEQGSNGDPNWSPDSSRISFGSTREGNGDLNIFTMSADGTRIVQLTHLSPPYEAGDTSWSSDGKTIAFEVDTGGKGQSDPNVPAEIWLTAADGSGQSVSTHQACSSVGCSPRFKPM